MSRLASVRPEDMDEAQRSLLDAIAGGARGKGDISEFITEDGALRGPFNAFLRSPALGEAAQKVGETVRFGTVLPAPLRELAILTCARHWRSNYEWAAHAKIARRVGLADDVIQGVMDGHPPAEQDLATVYRFVRDLNQRGRVDDALYADTVMLLGEQGTVELTILSGYYALIAQVLNAFQVPVPADDTAPFEE